MDTNAYDAGYRAGLLAAIAAAGDWPEPDEGEDDLDEAAIAGAAGAASRIQALLDAAYGI